MPRQLGKHYDRYFRAKAATFAAQTLRHKPKEEKITVSLDNSFLKSPYNELYIGTVPIEIIKVEKSDIKK